MGITLMKPSFTGISLAAVFALVFANHATAQNKVYKIVDEKGNVSYSQSPPPAAKKVEAINVAPANSSEGRNRTSPDLARQRNNQYEAYNEQRMEAMRTQQKAREDAERARMDSLRAECNRNRGSDCDSPETLRLLEAQRQPGGRNFRQPNQ